MTLRHKRGRKTVFLYPSAHSVRGVRYKALSDNTDYPVFCNLVAHICVLSLARRWLVLLL